MAYQHPVAINSTNVSVHNRNICIFTLSNDLGVSSILLGIMIQRYHVHEFLGSVFREKDYGEQEMWN